MARIFTDLYIETCPICLDIFGKKKNVHVLKCGHKFHKSCIFQCFEDTDLKKHKYYNKYSNIPIEGKCPLCRREQYDILYGKNKNKCIII